jgi:hypothetical protein
MREYDQATIADFYIFANSSNRCGSSACAVALIPIRACGGAYPDHGRSAQAAKPPRRANCPAHERNGANAARPGDFRDPPFSLFRPGLLPT